MSIRSTSLPDGRSSGFDVASKQTISESLARIARLSARTFSAPMAVVTYEDGADQVCHEQFGLTGEEAIAALRFLEPLLDNARETLIVADTLDEPTLGGEPPEVGGAQIRFVATKRIEGGRRSGAVWIFDRAPRKEVDELQLEDLSMVAGLLEDELERRRTHFELDRAGREMKTILEMIPDVLIFASPDRRITTVNRGFSKQFGYSAEETKGRTTEFLYAHPETFRQTTVRYNPAAPDQTEPYPVEYRRKDGTVFLGETIGVHVRDNEGQTIGYLGLTKDITEATRLEEERQDARRKLRHSERLLQETSRLASVGGGEFDLRTGEMHWSDELYRLHDLPVGQPLTVEQTVSFLGEKEQARLMEATEKSLESGEPFELEMPATTAGGREYWVRVVGAPRLEEGEVVGMRGYHQDITEQKQAELAKREFVSVVNHELRTPLTSIRGSLSLVVHGVMGEVPEEAMGLLQIALKNAERLGRLIDDILDLEKMEAGSVVIELGPVDVQEEIAAVLESNQQFAEDFGIEFSFSGPDRRIEICADPNKFQQVLTNLLSNAIKFSPSGARVDISVSQLGSNQVRVAVQDYGPGIPKSFQDRIFEKFTRADTSDTRRRPGTGLGLNIARGLTEKMGGRIDFETKVGEGTTFYVDFPIMSATGCGSNEEGR